MNYGIVIFPSEEVQEFANNYRKRYDSHFAFIPPHITVKSTFPLDDESLPKAVEFLNKVTSEIAPFSIEFNRFSTFFPTNNVVYILSLIHI